MSRGVSVGRRTQRDAEPSGGPEPAEASEPTGRALGRSNGSDPKDRPDGAHRGIILVVGGGVAKTLTLPALESDCSGRSGEHHRDRTRARLGLRTDRARLHARLRHPADDHLRPPARCSWRALRIVLLRDGLERAGPRRHPIRPWPSSCSRRWRSRRALPSSLERICYRPLRNAPRLVPLITRSGRPSSCRTRSRGSSGRPRGLPAAEVS